MSDRLHDHLSLGFRRGCVACAQAQADFALMAKWTAEHVTDSAGSAGSPSFAPLSPR